LIYFSFFFTISSLLHASVLIIKWKARKVIVKATKFLYKGFSQIAAWQKISI